MRPTAVGARVDVSARRAPGRQDRDRRRQTGSASSRCCPSQVASKMQIYRRKSVELNAATDAVTTTTTPAPAWQGAFEFTTDGRRRIYTLCTVPKKNPNGDSCLVSTGVKWRSHAILNIDLTFVFSRRSRTADLRCCFDAMVGHRRCSKANLSAAENRSNMNRLPVIRIAIQSL